MSKVRNPNCVTVFGAGITGLTVAHELIERGFRVQVSGSPSPINAIRTAAVTSVASRALNGAR